MKEINKTHENQFGYKNKTSCTHALFVFKALFEQWNKTSKKTNCHIYLIKTLKSIGFKEEILVNVYQSITLSQYLYAAPLLISASRSAKEEMLKQQTRFFKIIGITAERALSQYNIPTIESYIDQQCVAVTERILKDPASSYSIGARKEKVSTQHPWLPIHNKKNKHQQIPEQLPPISTSNDERWIQEQIYQPKTDRNNHRRIPSGNSFNQKVKWQKPKRLQEQKRLQ